MIARLAVALADSIPEVQGAVIKGAAKSYAGLAVLACLAIAVALWLDRRP